MNSETLKALEESIKRWEKVVNNNGEDKSEDECPLCNVFYHIGIDEEECVGCPIMNRTGEPDCFGAPFDAWHKNQTKENAQAMLDFLKELL